MACAPDLGGAVVGAADAHCGTMVQSVGACVQDATAADTAIPDYGETMFGTEGDDDDCKYHVTYTYSPITQNHDVFFTVHLTRKTDGSDVAGATPLIEAFIGNHAVAQTGDPTETSAGHYTLAAVRFDESGTWTVRFHFFEECSDSGPDSPHGHAAFYIRVL
jgi:hypothetical protein